MRARPAGQKPRPSRRRNPNRQPKHRQVKHPVAKRRASRAAALRLALAKRRIALGRRSLAFASFGVLLMLGYCATPRVAESPGHALGLVATSYAALPGWQTDHLAQALPALRNTCLAFAKLADDSPVGTQGFAGDAADWRPACAAVDLVPAGDDAAAAAYFTGFFQPFTAMDRRSEHGLFTSYYEMELAGARKPGGAYQYPLYKAPATPVTYTRAEIDNGALKNKGLELLWLKDPVDVFLLQIQGSARIKLPDGSVTRVGYAGNNGRDFVGVGKLMIDAGVVPKNKASMQSIRDWMKAHPKDAMAWMEKNPRYIFFRELGKDVADLGGPMGALGVTLTPTRSMAVDPAFLPLGVPIWLDTKAPDGTPLQRLMVAQDVGSAIKGPIRGDLFWGTGETALEFAGRMKSNGRYYVLLPKSAATRSTFIVTAAENHGSN